MIINKEKKINEHYQENIKIDSGKLRIFMKIFFLLMCSVCLFSCNKDTIEDKIVSNIERNCLQFPCTVTINKITDFDWNKMYVFSYSASSDQIETVTGIRIVENKEFTRKLIFTKDSKMVHYDELPTNIEGIIDNQVGFDDDGNYSYKIYSVENAVFEAQKYLQSDGTYYHLKQQIAK
jgi:hypothetical protein